jgi:hypothetical protein
MATPGRRLDLEYGSAGSSIGPEQAFFLGHNGKKVRFAPDAASDFFAALDTLVRDLRSGRLQQGSYFASSILDFDRDAILDVSFGVASGKLYFRLGETEIEPQPDDLDRFNEACIEFRPLARAGRRGTGRGALMGRHERDRLRRPQREPDLRDNYDRYVKKGEFNPTW